MKQAASFTKTPGWLDWLPKPSVPRFQLPPGAVDSHCHVFGPGSEFPFAATRKYTPCDAGKEALFALRNYLGLSRNVIVQATCHGTDNGALIDALEHANGRARGVACVSPDITADELNYLHASGIRGIRLNFVRRLAKAPPVDIFKTLGEKISRLGWHIVVYFEADDLPDLYDHLAAAPVPIIIDHMGRPNVSGSVEGTAFTLFQKLLEENSHIWTKVSCPERLSALGPPTYDDVIPFAQRLVNTFPDRVLWGTDWPHPNMKSHMPDDGILVDMIPHIAPTPEVRQKILVDNPMRLYWPEEG